MLEHLQEQFLHYVRSHHLFQKEDKILLAVSGGADSMLLCHLFLKTDVHFGIAHCNFQLRGEDAREDEKFVSTFAEDHNIPFHHVRFDTHDYAANHRLSIEMAARQLRYQWFDQIQEKYSYSLLATAHHKNDNAETLLLNLFRGTGIHGLHGILPKRDTLIRPMLFLTKAEIIQTMEAHHLAFRMDRTNLSSDYTRNYLRNEVIPLIEKRFPQLIDTLHHDIRRFSEAEELYQMALEKEKVQLINRHGKEVLIPFRKLLKKRPLDTLAFEVLHPYGFSYEQAEEIIDLADRPSGRVIRSSSHQLLKDRNYFIISPLYEKNKHHFAIEEKDQNIETGDLSLTISRKKASNYTLLTDRHIAAIDIDKIDFPLTLRRWRAGDYFYPLGMRKKKKLSRFFIDEKLSLNQKEEIWIIASGLKILWIIGMRIDDRCKITSTTTNILEIKASFPATNKKG